MLTPRETVTRECKSLNGIWRFALDPDGNAVELGWASGLPPDARDMPVPASYNDIYPDADIHSHVGEAWYETTARVPRGWAGRRIVLRFGSVTHRGVVWVDGRQVAEHAGGFTPFEADVTDLVQPGKEHRISVLVDNTLSWETIPPGYIDDTPDGPRQRLLFDFFNYSGIHRTVWLYSTPKAHITDVTVGTSHSGSTGTVTYEIETQDADGHEIRVVLKTASGDEVALGEGGSGQLKVDDVNLWEPGQGYLYELVAELWSGDLVDSYPVTVGIRSVEVDGTRFLINGRPFYFRGFGKHEDTPVRGRAHDDVFMVHDFALMEWLGANSFRTSHYPYAEEVLDYADRHGIVVIDEVPAVGINSGLAAGVFGAEPFQTFSEDAVGQATQEAHRRVITELIARDKNHPCVVMWSIANEPESITPEARSYFEPLVEHTRRLDPRPVGFANVQGSNPDVDVISDLFDVLMINRYYGWYVASGDLAAAERALEDELNAWVDKHGKPMIITEYGADTMPGQHSVLPTPWTEEFQVEFFRTSHRVFDRVEAVVGEHVWNFADFATVPGVMRVGGNRKGVFTRVREPKAAAYELRRRWRGSS